MKPISKFVFICSLLTVLISVDGFAQQRVLKENERSTVVIDVDVKRFRENSLVQLIDFKKLLNQFNLAAVQQFEMKNVDRFLGSVQIPENPLSMYIGPGEVLPLNFYLQIQFNKKVSADEAMSGIKEVGVKSEDNNGKTYYMPDDGRTPENLRMSRIDDTTLEIGTEMYVKQAERNFLTDRLASSWKTIPGSTAFRLSLDIEGNRSSVSDLVEMAKMNAPAQIEPILNLFNDMQSLTLGVDPAGKKMFMLRSGGEGDEETEKLRKSMDGLLGMAKFMGMQQIGQSEMSDGDKESLKKMLSGIKATASENVVSVDIERPENLEATVKNLMKK